MLIHYAVGVAVTIHSSDRMLMSLNIQVRQVVTIMGNGEQPDSSLVVTLHLFNRIEKNVF